MEETKNFVYEFRWLVQCSRVHLFHWIFRLVFDTFTNAYRFECGMSFISNRLPTQTSYKHKSQSQSQYERNNLPRKHKWNPKNKVWIFENERLASTRNAIFFFISIEIVYKKPIRIYFTNVYCTQHNNSSAKNIRRHEVKTNDFPHSTNWNYYYSTLSFCWNLFCYFRIGAAAVDANAFEIGNWECWTQATVNIAMGNEFKLCAVYLAIAECG